MDELRFTNISIETVGEYVEGLILEPHIGNRNIPFCKPIRVRFEKQLTQPSPEHQLGNIVAFYVIAYFDTVKIGSSKLNYVVTRMYTQAPLVGTVSAITIVKEDGVHIEEIEDYVAETVSKELDQGIEVVSKRNVNHLRSYVEKLLEASSVKELKFKDLVDKVWEIGEKSWLILREISRGLEVISSPNVFTYTSGLDQVDLEVLNTVIRGSRRIVYRAKDVLKNRKTGYGELIVLKNGLCLLKVKETTLIDFCDKLCFNFLFETVD